MRSQRLYETRREVLEALERLVRELGATVYLFGSYARGTTRLRATSTWSSCASASRAWSTRKGLRS
ncbi:MAG: nucleotidyltransferase domain-containing protein [Thermofilaceae archaeon]